ncbi:hypothetical protein E2C01_035830 [Portunus trituberculatus]|uniref:Uncharacterized protein n=1 Tax=Portunus trituberculatus TaxID=210409 RepID=A0A5B7F9E8_PORTR|nr:hypothetical protein [Portunus trituberculatus]
MVVMLVCTVREVESLASVPTLRSRSDATERQIVDNDRTREGVGEGEIPRLPARVTGASPASLSFSPSTSTKHLPTQHPLRQRPKCQPPTTTGLWSAGVCTGSGRRGLLECVCIYLGVVSGGE